MIVASLPFSFMAGASTIEDLEKEIDNKLLLYSGRISYTDDVYMGSKKVLSYYLNNILYSSKTLTTSYSDLSSTIDLWIQTPKTIVMAYDGIKTPSFPVNARALLKNYVRFSGIVLTDENALYEPSAPTNYKGCTNVWRAINGDTTWHTPEEQESVMLLTSRRADYGYDLYYTRAQNAEYMMTASNTLSPRTEYIENKFAKSPYGYISSSSGDTTFTFVNRSFSDSSKQESPVRAPLGESATQYYIDYRPIIDISGKIRADYAAIKNASSHYNEEAVINYYNAILNVIKFNLKTELADINDENASSLVETAAAKVQNVSNNYNESLENLGERYIDASEAREYVNNNYQNANVNFTNAGTRFNTTSISDVTYNGTKYNFGKNLAFCSDTAIKSSDIGQNYVNSWVTMPKTVVMVYDGQNETSFPVKIGFGRGASDSSYTGSNLQSVFLGGESSNNSGSASSMFYMGNSNWLVSNAIASIAPTDWFSINQINGTMSASNVPAGGTNLSNQYGGMFNKIVLNNSLYEQNKKINPTDGKQITFYYRYYYQENDTLPHPANPSTRQYVLNIVPLKEKLAKVQNEYNEKIGKNGENAYTSEQLEAYYKATYKLLSFNINDQFIGCSDSNAYEKTENCYNKMNQIIDEYNIAYDNLKELITVSFKNYAGEIIESKQYEKGEMPTPPANTSIQAISDAYKYHYTFSWPTINPATSDVTYNERRATVACTLDEGVVSEKPTCQKEGKMKYHCDICNGDYYKSIDIVDHDYSVYKAQYTNGTKYNTSLKHDINCANGGEILSSQACTFELLSNGEATKIYRCRECNGLAVYTKAKYTIKFVDENGAELSTKEYYEDQEVDVPALPANGIDDSGHFSYKWDIEPSTTPSADVTYTIQKATVAHEYTNYVYNNDANRANPNGTETARCDIDGCEYENTRTCSEKHTPTEFEAHGIINIASNAKGAPSVVPAKNITITIEGTDTIEGTELKASTNENGEFTLPMLNEGEYTLLISGESAIERKVTLVINPDKADGDEIALDNIGIIPFDYNQDGIINTVDATLMSKGNITKAEANLFKSLFNKSIKYDTLIV